MLLYVKCILHLVAYNEHTQCSRRIAYTYSMQQVMYSKCAAPGQLKIQQYDRNTELLSHIVVLNETSRLT